jgi:hypothetical protein
MSKPIPVRSEFRPELTVQVDQWAVNPLLDDAVQAVPDLVNLALVTGGQPPTMFDSGDTPPFTASGTDPRFLASMPWKIRHAAAMAADRLTVLSWVEQYGHDEAIDMASPGRNEYVARFRGWLAGSWINPDFTQADATQTAAAEADLYNSLVGPHEAAVHANLAAVNAKGNAFNASRDWRVQPGRAQR